MLMINVPLDKLSTELFPDLKSWLLEINSVREVPVSITLAVLDDIPQGVIVYERGHILYLWVDADSRQTGVGTTLVKHVMGVMEAPTYTARVHPTNVDGICFFHKLGWQIAAWYTAVDGKCYFRMSSTPLHTHYTPAEDQHLKHFVSNVPVFLSMAGNIY